MMQQFPAHRPPRGTRAAAPSRSFAAGCGSSDSDHGRHRSERRKRRWRNADRRLRHPLSPVRAGSKSRRLHRLRRRTDGSDRRRRSAARRNSRTPRSKRSSATSARASSKRSISAATITPEREKEVAFSDPYYLSEQAILVKEGSDITGLADLEGKVVAAQQGTTGLELGKEKADAERTPALSRRPGRDQRAQGRARSKR